jgi:hypothetical protein
MTSKGFNGFYFDGHKITQKKKHAQKMNSYVKKMGCELPYGLSGYIQPDINFYQ